MVRLAGEFVLCHCAIVYVYVIMYVRHVRRGLAAVGRRFRGLVERKRQNAQFTPTKSTPLRYSVSKAA